MRLDRDAVLPPSFYTTNPAPGTAEFMERGLSTSSSVGPSQRSAIEIGQDPAIVSLLLPLLSFNDYQDFLLKGKTWFQSVSAVGAANSLSGQMATMTMSMLDQWNDTLRKMEDDRRRRENSGLHLMIESINHDIKMGKDKAGLIAMGMLVIAASFIGSSSAAAPLGGAQPISQAMGHLTQYIPSTMAAELGVITAYYAMMAMYQFALLNPSLDKIASQAGKRTVTTQTDIAQRYALVILSMMSDPSFHGFLLQNVIGRMTNAREMSEESKVRAAVMVKLVLLMTALALLYKHETGKITDLEIAAYLKGEMKPPEGDIRGVLVGCIQAHLSLLPLEERQKILMSVLEYLDGDPQVDTLVNPAKVFEGILNTKTVSIVESQAA